MIFVNRTIIPPYLSARAIIWLADLRKARKDKDVKKFKSLQGRYGHEKIKSALDSMFSGKCAYCEVVIGVVATAHIEHFRPKHRYVSLTYTWDNFLLSCPKCNDKAHKGTKFPGASAGGPFLDPSLVNPNIYLRFDYDVASGLTVVTALHPRGQLMIDTFGLNTRVDLVAARTNYIKTLIAIKPYELLDSKVSEILAVARWKTSPYHAWIRSLNL